MKSLTQTNKMLRNLSNCNRKEVDWWENLINIKKYGRDILKLKIIINFSNSIFKTHHKPSSTSLNNRF